MELSAIMRKSPFARFLLYYLTGILLASFRDPIHPRFSIIVFISILIMLSFMLIIVRWPPGYHTNWISGSLSAFILLTAGFLNMSLHYEYGARVIETAGFQGYVLMEIIEPPECKEKSVLTTAMVKARHENHNWIIDKQKILVSFEYDSLTPKLTMGKQLLAQVKLRGIDPPHNPDEFDYRQYLAIRHIYNRSYLPAGSWKVVGEPDKYAPRIISHHMQQRLLQAYQKIGLNHALYGLLSAITLGYKNDLETQTKQAFSQAGVMHVMALSGFNVAIIAMVLGYLFFFTKWFKAGNILKTVVIIMVIWLFAFITGLSPSVTRASVMITFILAGRLMERRINTYNILFLSAFVLLVRSPAMVADVSFQLSFAAVLGILMFYQPIYGIIARKRFLTDKLWQLFSVSCAAQLATLPFTLYYFHQFPVYFWITNIYVVPLVSLIICVSGIFLIVSAFDPLVLVLGKALSFLLTLLHKSVEFIEFLPASLIDNLYINEFQVVLLITILILLGFFLIQRKIRLMLCALGLLAVFQATGLRHVIGINHQKHILVGAVKKISTVSLISGRNCLMLCDSAISQSHPVIRYAFENFWIRHGLSNKVRTAVFQQEDCYDVWKLLQDCGSGQWMGSNAFFKFADKRVAVMNDNSLYQKSAGKPLKIDILIVNGKVNPDFQSIKRLMQPECIVLGSSMNSFQVKRWLETGKRIGSKVWNTNEQGAFLCSIDKTGVFKYPHGQCPDAQ